MCDTCDAVSQSSKKLKLASQLSKKAAERYFRDFIAPAPAPGGLIARVSIYLRNCQIRRTRKIRRIINLTST